MANVRPKDQVLSKPVACWLTQKDHRRLIAAAETYSIKVAEFIRSVIIDALADEDEREKKKLEDVKKSINLAPPGGYQSFSLPPAPFVVTYKT